MASKPPPSIAPAPPTGGSGKFVVLAILLLGVIGGAVAWKMSQTPPPPTVVYVDAAAPPPTTVAGGRNLDDDIPIPPPVADAGADAGQKVATGTGTKFDACDPGRKCTGTTSSELEQALGFRAKQAHRCYDNALAQDATLKGKVMLNVRIGPTGQVCNASVVSNDMGSQQVASCVAGYFRNANFPAPKGGCAEVNVPMNFMPRQ